MNLRKSHKSIGITHEKDALQHIYRDVYNKEYCLAPMYKIPIPKIDNRNQSNQKLIVEGIDAKQ